MARKKHRNTNPTRSSMAVATAVLQPADSAERSAPQTDRFWLEDWYFQMARWLGSLQIAIFILIAGAFILMIGTMVESWYSGRVAQELIYRTWWFTGFLGLFFINILFAALKKYPWKKHQIGFLITHVGLLMMISGGILNSLSGIDSLMSLVDCREPRIYEETRTPNQTDKIIDKDDSVIVVTKDGDPHRALEYPIQPGSLQWHSDEYLKPNYHPMLSILHVMAHPLPYSWRADLGKDAELEILNYYPHIGKEPYTAADKGESRTFPAVKYSLFSPNFGTLAGQWVAHGTADHEHSMGGGTVEMLGPCPSSLIQEFLTPRPADELGSKGQLVLALGSEIVRVSVDKMLSGVQPVGSRGWKIQGKRYFPDTSKPKSGDVPPVSPAVEFELIAPDNQTYHWVSGARIGSEIIPGADDKGTQPAIRVPMWYHPPDYRFGQKTPGLLQMAVNEEGQLFFRSFSSSKGEFQFEKSGRLDEVGETIPIWRGMNWEFRAEELLPRAVTKLRYVPRDLRPGLEESLERPGVHCRLKAGKDFEDFWLMQDGKEEEVKLGGGSYKLRFRTHERKIEFELKLLRAEQWVDPGTQVAATFTSYVQLTDRKQGIDAEDRVITMNHPLEHGGFTFFQSNYTLLRDLNDGSLMFDSAGKPISVSGFTVAHDPGIWLKYLGSTMLALGIFCMFYMKAYFFTGKGRATRATPLPAKG